VTAETARIDYVSVFPSGVRALVGLQRAVDAAGLEPLLLELVKMRASQINGCAYCLDMHSKDARALGESEQRLHLLAAWREAACYDAREQAALAWCEDLTLISQRGAPDAVYQDLEQAFSPDEIVALTLAVVAITTAGTDCRYRCEHRWANTCHRTAARRTRPTPGGNPLTRTPAPNRSVNHASSTT
jgi:AhpD family alkylhydroperoxidase